MDSDQIAQIKQREWDLVRRVQAGDERAFTTLTTPYYQKLFGVAFGLLQNSEDARECVQDALLKTYKNMDSFRFDASFYTWAYRITVNQAIDYRRKAAHRRTEPLDQIEYELATQEPSPQKARERKILGDKIAYAVSLLPTNQRTTFILREVEGLSYTEIAEAEGIPEGTVMSELFYAREKLQGMLKREAREEGLVD
jgi:RNA polymerase sigma-70 factor, ECF subfamily